MSYYCTLCHSMVHCVIIWYIESHYGKLCHPMVHYVILWSIVLYYVTGGSTIFQSVLACLYTVVHYVILLYIILFYGTLCHNMVRLIILWYIISSYGTLCHTMVKCVILCYRRFYYFPKFASMCIHCRNVLKVFKMLYHVIPFGLKTPRNMINITIINSTILTKSSVEVLSVTYLKEMLRLVRFYLLLQDKSIATITSQVKYQAN